MLLHAITRKEDRGEERPYTIRAIRKEELDEAFEIRRQTNYVFSKSNIETSWKLQPESFLVAVSDTGELYGTVSMVDYCEGVAYLSLLAVKEELRAKKIGNDLLLAVLEKCGKKNKFMRCIFPLESVFNRLDLFMVRSKVALGRTEPVKSTLVRVCLATAIRAAKNVNVVRPQAALIYRV
ncbi:hypothetical protein HPB48_019105 [Haemaphysalis longicornis]|uniref:N-acetyltransferase domain-containing protein n=1 Tax=Haemaphysalis longicornis TaxID=44386 RepID=A0A9J6G8W7_HAELO|nr:hypothetical protein HPB48_019105 [Haemaphysalis longicornis]